MSQVSKHFSSPNAGASSGTRAEKDSGGSRAPRILGKRNISPASIALDAKMPEEPCKSCKKSKQVNLGPFPSQPSTEVGPLHSTIKLTQVLFGSKTEEEVHSKNSGAQLVHRTTLITYLGVFDDCSSSDHCPDHTVHPKLVKHVPQDWILNCHFSLGLCNETWS